LPAVQVEKKLQWFAWAAGAVEVIHVAPRNILTAKAKNRRRIANPLCRTAVRSAAEAYSAAHVAVRCWREIVWAFGFRAVAPIERTFYNERVQEAAELAECGCDDLAETVVHLHALMCATQRLLLDAIAVLDEREAWADDGATSMAAWLAARLGVSHRTGAEWTRVGRALQQLPALGSALAESRLSWDQLSPLTRVATAETDEALAEEAAGWSAAQCQAVARRARPVSPEEAADAHRRRSLRWTWDLEARVLELRGRLPDEAGATVVAALERIADSYKPDPETGMYELYEARAADALVELASSHLGAATEPDRATVVVHADASALTNSGGVAEVAGGPPLAAEAVRRQACDARVEVVALGADGQPVGVGRARRSVPGWLSRQLRRRDGGCRFPGCERRRWGHAHHVRHWADGGPTDLANLLWLCPHHHRVVHEGGWSIEGDPARDVIFVRPDGRPFPGQPPPLPPELSARMANWLGG
jgi:hypothetical protein